MFENRTYTVHGNAKSPGYAWCISTLAEIWQSFPANLVSTSFDKCGISSGCDLHSVLKQILNENHLINDYVDDLQANEDLDLMDEEDNYMFDPVNSEICSEINAFFWSSTIFWSRIT